MRLKSHETQNRIALALFIVLATLFLGRGTAVIFKHGSNMMSEACGDIEALVKEASENFIDEGFTKRVGLPVYRGYPNESPIERLREERVYAHLLPGPEYVLTAFYAVFGKTDRIFQLSRFFPLLLQLVTITLLAMILEREYFDRWPWAKVVISLGLFFIPAQKNWVLQLAGQSIAYSFIFALAALSVVSAHDERRASGARLAAAFLIGYASLYNWLPFCFAVASVPLAITLLSPRETPNVRAATFLTLAAFIGLGMAFITRLIQIAIYLGSFSQAIQSQVGIAKLRVARTVAETHVSVLQVIGRYSHAIEPFFYIKAFTLIVIAAFVLWLCDRSIKIRRRWFAGLMVSAIGAFMFGALMRNFAMAHQHLHPRTFVVFFLCGILVAIHVAVDKAKQRGYSPTSLG